ncbi:transmembrane protein, putative, partial [Bodo saltans]
GGSTIYAQIHATIGAISLLGSTPITISVTGNSNIGPITSIIAQDGLSIYGVNSIFQCMTFSALVSSTLFSFNGITFSSNACSFISCVAGASSLVVSVVGYSQHTINNFPVVSIGGALADSSVITWSTSHLSVGGASSVAAFSFNSVSSATTFLLRIVNCADCTDCGGNVGVSKSLNMRVPRLLSANDVQSTTFTVTVIGSKLYNANLGSDVSLLSFGTLGATLPGPITIGMDATTMVSYETGNLVHFPGSPYGAVQVSILGTVTNADAQVAEQNAIVRIEGDVGASLYVTVGGVWSSVGQCISIGGTATNVVLAVLQTGSLIAGTGVSIGGVATGVSITASASSSSITRIDTTDGLGGSICELSSGGTNVFMSFVSCQVRAGTSILTSAQVSAVTVTGISAVLVAMSHVFEMNALGHGPNSFQFSSSTSIHAGGAVLLAPTANTATGGISWTSTCAAVAPCGMYATGGAAMLWLGSARDITVAASYTTFTFASVEAITVSSVFAPTSGNTNSFSFVSCTFSGSAPVFAINTQVTNLAVVVQASSVSVTSNALVSFTGTNPMGSLSVLVTQSSVTITSTSGNAAALYYSAGASIILNQLTVSMIGSSFSIRSSAVSGSVALVRLVSSSFTITTANCGFFLTDLTTFFASSSANSVTSAIQFTRVTSAGSTFSLHGLTVSSPFVQPSPGTSIRALISYPSTSSNIVASSFTFDCMDHQFLSSLDYIFGVAAPVTSSSFTFTGCYFSALNTLTSIFDPPSSTQFTTASVTMLGSNFRLVNVLPPNQAASFASVLMQCVYHKYETDSAASTLTSDYAPILTLVSDPGAPSGCVGLYSSCWTMPKRPTSTKSKSESIEPDDLEVYDSGVFAITKTFGTTHFFSGSSVTYMNQKAGTVFVNSGAAVTHLTSAGVAFVYAGGAVTSMIGAGQMHISGSVTSLSMTGTTTLDISAGLVTSLTISGGSTVTIRSGASVGTISLLGSTPITMTVSGSSNIGPITSSVAQSGLTIIGDSSTFQCMTFSALVSSSLFTFTGITFTSNICPFITCTAGTQNIAIDVEGYSTHTVNGFGAVSITGSALGSLSITWHSSRLSVTGWEYVPAFSVDAIAMASSLAIKLIDCTDCANCGGNVGVNKALNVYVPRLLFVNQINKGAAIAVTMTGTKVIVTNVGSDVSLFKFGYVGGILAGTITITGDYATPIQMSTGNVLNLVSSAADTIVVSIAGTILNLDTLSTNINAIVSCDGDIGSSLAVTVGGTWTSIREAISIAGDANNVFVTISPSGKFLVGNVLVVGGTATGITITAAGTSNEVLIDTSSGIVAGSVFALHDGSAIQMNFQSCRILAGKSILSSSGTVFTVAVYAETTSITSYGSSTAAFHFATLGVGTNTFTLRTMTSLVCSGPAFQASSVLTSGLSWAMPCTSVQPCTLQTVGGSSPLFSLTGTANLVTIVASYTSISFVSGGVLSAQTITSPSSANTVLSFVSCHISGQGSAFTFPMPISVMSAMFSSCSISLFANTFMTMSSSLAIVSVTITQQSSVTLTALTGDAAVLSVGSVSSASTIVVLLVDFSKSIFDIHNAATLGSSVLVMIQGASPSAVIAMSSSSIKLTDLTSFYSSSTGNQLLGALSLFSTSVIGSRLYFASLTVDEQYSQSAPSVRALMSADSNSVITTTSIIELSCFDHPYLAANDLMFNIAGSIRQTTFSLSGVFFGSQSPAVITTAFYGVSGSYSSIDIAMIGSNFFLPHVLPPNGAAGFQTILMQCAYNGYESSTAVASLTSDYTGVNAAANPSSGCPPLYAGCWTMPIRPTSTRSRSESASLSFEPLNLEVYDNPVFAVTKTYGTTTVFHGASIGTLSQLVGTATIRSGAIVTVFNSYDIANIDSGGVVSTMTGYGNMNIAGTATQVTVSAQSGVMSTITVSGSSASVTGLSICASGTTVIIGNNAVVNAITITGSATSNVLISLYGGGTLSALHVSTPQNNFQLLSSGTSTMGCIVFDSVVTSSLISMIGVTHTTNTCSFLQFNGNYLMSISITIDSQSVHSISGASHHAVVMDNVGGEMQDISILWRQSQLTVQDDVAFSFSPSIGGTSGLSITVQQSRPCVAPCGFASGANLPNLKTVVKGLVALIGGVGGASQVAINILSSAITSSGTLIASQTILNNLRVIVSDTMSPVGGTYLYMTSGSFLSFADVATSITVSVSGSSVTTSNAPIIFASSTMDTADITFSTAWLSGSGSYAAFAIHDTQSVNIVISDGGTLTTSGPAVFSFTSVVDTTITAIASQTNNPVIYALAGNSDVIYLDQSSTSLSILLQSCSVIAGRSMIYAASSVKGLSFSLTAGGSLVTSGGTVGMTAGFHFMDYIGGITGDGGSQAYFTIGVGCFFNAQGTSSNFYFASPSVVISGVGTASSATAIAAGGGYLITTSGSALALTVVSVYTTFSFGIGMSIAGDLLASGTHVFRFTNSKVYSTAGSLLNVLGAVHGSTEISVVSSTVVALSPSAFDLILLRTVDAPSTMILVQDSNIQIRSATTPSLLRFSGPGTVTSTTVSIKGDMSFSIVSVALTGSNVMPSVIQCTNGITIGSGTHFSIANVGSFLDNAVAPGAIAVIRVGSSHLDGATVTISSVTPTVPLTMVDTTSWRSLLLADLSSSIANCYIAFVCVTHSFISPIDSILAILSPMVNTNIVLRGVTARSSNAAAGLMYGSADVASMGNLLILRGVNLKLTTIIPAAAASAFTTVSVVCGWQGGPHYPITSSMFDTAAFGSTLSVLTPTSTSCVATDGSNCWAFSTSSRTKTRSTSPSLSDSKSIPTQTQSQSFEPEHLLVYDAGVFAITKTYGSTEMFSGASVTILEQRAGTTATIHSGASVSTLTAKGKQVTLESGGTVTEIVATSGVIDVAGHVVNSVTSSADLVMVRQGGDVGTLTATAGTVEVSGDVGLLVAGGALNVTVLSGATITLLQISSPNTVVSISGSASVGSILFASQGTLLSHSTIIANGAAVTIGSIDATNEPLNFATFSLTAATVGCITLSTVTASSFTASGISFTSITCSFLAIDQGISTSSVSIVGKSFIQTTVSLMNFGAVSGSSIVLKQSMIDVDMDVIVVGQFNGVNDIQIQNFNVCSQCASDSVTDVLFSITGATFLSVMNEIGPTASLSMTLSSSTAVLGVNWMAANSNARNIDFTMMAGSSITTASDVFFMMDALTNMHVVVRDESVIAGTGFFLVASKAITTLTITSQTDSAWRLVGFGTVVSCNDGTDIAVLMESGTQVHSFGGLLSVDRFMTDVVVKVSGATTNVVVSDLNVIYGNTATNVSVLVNDGATVTAPTDAALVYFFISAEGVSLHLTNEAQFTGYNLFYASQLFSISVVNVVEVFQSTVVAGGDVVGIGGDPISLFVTIAGTIRYTQISAFRLVNIQADSALDTLAASFDFSAQELEASLTTAALTLAPTGPLSQILFERSALNCDTNRFFVPVLVETSSPSSFNFTLVSCSITLTSTDPSSVVSIVALTSVDGTFSSYVTISSLTFTTDSSGAVCTRALVHITAAVSGMTIVVTDSASFFSITDSAVGADTVIAGVLAETASSSVSGGTTMTFQQMTIPYWDSAVNSDANAFFTYGYHRAFLYVHDDAVVTASRITLSCVSHDAGLSAYDTVVYLRGAAQFSSVSTTIDTSHLFWRDPTKALIQFNTPPSTFQTLSFKFNAAWLTMNGGSATITMQSIAAIVSSITVACSWLSRDVQVSLLHFNSFVRPVVTADDGGLTRDQCMTSAEGCWSFPTSTRSSTSSESSSASNSMSNSVSGTDTTTQSESHTDSFSTSTSPSSSYSRSKGTPSLSPSFSLSVSTSLSSSSPSSSYSRSKGTPSLSPSFSLSVSTSLSSSKSFSTSVSHFASLSSSYSLSKGTQSHFLSISLSVSTSRSSSKSFSTSVSRSVSGSQSTTRSMSESQSDQRTSSWSGTSSASSSWSESTSRSLTHSLSNTESASRHTLSFASSWSTSLSTSHSQSSTFSDSSSVSGTESISAPASNSVTDNNTTSSSFSQSITAKSATTSTSKTALPRAHSETRTRSRVPPSRSMVPQCFDVAADSAAATMPHISFTNASVITRTDMLSSYIVFFTTTMPNVGPLLRSTSVVVSLQQRLGNGSSSTDCVPQSFDVVLVRSDNGTRPHKVSVFCNPHAQIVTYDVQYLDGATLYTYNDPTTPHMIVPLLPLQNTTSALVRVTSVSGCPSSVFPSTADCPLLGGTLLLVEGSGFDALPPLTATITFDLTPSGRSSTKNTTVCSNITVLSPSQLSCVLGPGSGDRGNLTISAGPSGSIIAHKEAVLAYVPVYRCPTDIVVSPDGLECSSNGACDIYTGTCACGASLSTGYWTGVACSQCLSAYANSSDCRAACPVGSYSQICSGHGTCSNGACEACFPPYTGSLCELLCPLTNGAVCNGRGTCNSDATCTCSSPAWTGENCNMCAYGFVGAHCEQMCPVATPSGLVCNGQGLCNPGSLAALCVCSTPGYCGDSCDKSGSDCAMCSSPVMYGPTCTSFCPGIVTGPMSACNGNGYCLNGTAGLGLCVCKSEFALADCSRQCPANRTNSVCSAPQGRCNVTDASCICAAGYAGATCELACPTGTRILTSGSTSANEVAVCSGQGTCDAVNGTCSCTAGYVGTACSVRCSDYCNHGECDRVAPYSCRCHRSLALGFWAGSSCDVCDAAYTGSRCTSLCPAGTENGLPCGGRGLCVASGPSAATCDCSVNRDGTGRWSGVSCSVCAAGFYGANCSSECPGTSCSPCSDHGTCAAGVSGNGTCTCFVSEALGYWRNADCSQCKFGYYGLTCTLRCPVNSAGIVCGGHGNCSSGVDGTGLCSCSPAYSGVACESCSAGMFGPNCSACPTTVVGAACSGHGTCSDGLNGSGTCTCVLGYGGLHCGFQCPISRGTTCAPGGTCVASSTCSCTPPHALDITDGTCSSCITGYWGVTCTSVCPGGALNPCSSHGTCNTLTGACACHASAALGYFSGPLCNSCSPLYNSSNCNILCPLNASTSLPCSGRGTCWAGKCNNCAPTTIDVTNNVSVTCGAACEKSNTQCTGALHLCPRGYYSANCTLLCPGATLLDPATTACTGNGYCNSDNGTCFCSRGYWGDACSGTCPGGAASPCSNRGECSSDTGECTCDGTAYGLACEYPCPGGYNDPCSGSGVCGPTGACACFASTALGFFAGTACDRCAPYYSGDACNVSCDPRTGVVVGKSCVCAAGFVGADCSLACPLSDDSLICSGRGTCRAAASGTYAECVCEADYYGAACGVYCTAAACASRFGLKHAQCNATTGACECQDNDAGHFGGATCDDCATLYWGPECDRACPCNGRGSCNRYTARCTCFANDRGHFSGASCSLCALGYIGVSCEIRNTEFSVAGLSNPTSITSSEGSGVIASTPTAASVLFRDSAFSVLYSASTTIAAFASEGWGNGTLTYLGRVVVDGNMVASMDVWNSTHMAVRTMNSTTTVASNGSASGGAPPTSSTFVFPRGQTLWNENILVILAVPLLNVTRTSQAQHWTVAHRSHHLLANSAGVSGNISIAAFDADAKLIAAVSINTTTDTSTVHILHPDSSIAEGATTTLDGAATYVGILTLPPSPNTQETRAIVLATQRTSAALAPLQSWWFALYIINATDGNVLASRFSTELVGTSVVCNHTSGSVLCPYITHCSASVELDVLLCSVSIYAADHTLLVSLPLSNLTKSNVAPLLLEVPEGGNVSAAAFDVLDNCVLLGMAPFAATTPSSVYRVRVLPNGLTLVSQLRFALAGAAYPVVQQMLVNSTSRSLYASLLVAATSSSASSTASVQHINLFGIWAVDPPVVDRDGGTLVTYIGTGFIANPPPMCVLTDDTGVVAEAPALVSDTNTVYCNATLSLSADSICDTATLNLRYANR